MPPTYSAPVLQSGTYIITSVSTNLKVSRTLGEDKSLLPKKVFVLPAKEQASTWEVTRNRDGTYTLKNKGSPVVEIEDKLFAQLTGPPLETRWKVSSVYWHGADQWIIETPSGSDGWLLKDDPAADKDGLKQVDVGPLIANLSLPPQYPAYERFRFTRVRATVG
ncbi:hypothetical protein TWF788_002607 [Orbilia oligospora]|uniref:Ricin B lectin domain-containing protein n=1 Tax=Orbilia oligospora TaxID=2813651 RepID=A0A6G1LUY7_ORBOL|nr:hypothetical protein TWF788_002607 [Orbilia oligospora]KAF3215126.1 hypothetical protein TWF191_009419 [Orbilia oligospora]KAF3222539.1 hypothetical protein TWF679_006010 [Orbilia oligospora]KAF3234334.1 hypothetical protein TWF192_001568 [Orbilia oligospora]